MGSNPIKEIKAKFIAVLNSGNLKKLGRLSDALYVEDPNMNIEDVV